MTSLALAGVYCASARKRARAISSIGPEHDQDALLFVALVARTDWSAQVRATATLTVGNVIASVLSPRKCIIDALYPMLHDSEASVRETAFDALATPLAFDAVCAALVLETNAAVRHRAFACLTKIAKMCHRASEEMQWLDRSESGLSLRDDQILCALEPSPHQLSEMPTAGKQMHALQMESALMKGEYAGVFADGVDDADPSVSAAAVRAAAAFHVPFAVTIRVGEAIDSLAVRALRRGKDPAVRVEAMSALTMRGGEPAPPHAVDELVLEVTEWMPLCSEHALRVLAARPAETLAEIRCVVECLEAQLVRVRGAGSSELCPRFMEINSSLYDVLRANVGLSHVLDLLRRSSDRLAEQVL